MPRRSWIALIRSVSGSTAAILRPGAWRALRRRRHRAAGRGVSGAVSIDRRRLALRAVIAFLPLAVLATGLAGTVYLVAQQGLRLGADSPQLQLAEDAGRALDAGASPSTVTGPATVDVARSLASFVVVFRPDDKPLAWSGQLDGVAPAPPTGVLDHAAIGTPNRVTWQPRAGVRLATVTVRWSGGTVLAGRSLREVEQLEDQALLLVAAGWGATLTALMVTCAAAAWLAERGRGDATTRG